MAITLRKSLIAGLAVSAVVPAVLWAASSSATAAQPAQQPKYQPEMVSVLAKSLGIDEGAAVARLDREAAQQQKLADLTRGGLRIDGSFVDANGTLTVNTTDASSAATARSAGLATRAPARGEAALSRVQAQLDQAATRQVPAGVASWSVDVAADVVKVEVSDAARPQAKAFLAEVAKFGAAVQVVRTGTPLQTQAVVYPGSKMNINGGSGYCSVGFGARNSSGTQYLVSAGHCIAGLPSLYNNGAAFAKGTATRFAVGSNSVDMGVAKINSGNSIATTVGTWGATTNVAVRGGTKASVGSSICKSGATSGWTCGTIKAYNVTVTYTDQNGGPDTVVRGLASSSVCTMGGDSGGAYISGNQAQGMTSGGPTGQQCTFNGGVQSGKSSYFQPLSDALSYYGLTLTVG
ncbi:S1 family peptidase [Actinokineospora cianjurensis]|uniref:Alpha-lytic protease prodomain-containing protein n=1 Tax=Actinokineospora cianjurensis TaxID=585224 RepID=A0A421B3G3_9PSEU|nr:S1 family peptidase [Actinokineospora cianjurensis]RLK58921.1 alpha-lytic protease prodomain-containing protein [Actinokineospora cianjurensis]